MLFLEQEREKLEEWWISLSLKEMGFYLFSSFFLLFIIFLYYAFLGITDLFHWYRFGRAMTECFLLLFLTQLMTGKSLLHPFWRIGYIPFFAWILIFPYVLIHAINGMPDASFSRLSPYFLTAIAALLLIFFMMNVICRVYVGKKLAAALCLGAVCFFSFSAFFFLIHYEFMGIMMSPRETFFALYEPIRWFREILLPRMGLFRLSALVLCLILYTAVSGKWIYESAYYPDIRWVRKSRRSFSLLHRILQFLVFFGCLWLLLRWASECFPLHDYELAKQYKEYIQFMQNAKL